MTEFARPQARPFTPAEIEKIEKLPLGKLTPLDQLEKPLKVAALDAAAERIEKEAARKKAEEADLVAKGQPILRRAFSP